MSTDEQTAAEQFGLSDALPEGWRPEEGDLVIGKILSMTKGWSDYQQSYYPILVIHNELTDEDIAIHGFHFVMLDRLTSLRPKVGERIGIKMGPKIPLKGNPKQSVQTYTIKVDGRSEDIDWDDIQSPRTQPTSEQDRLRQTSIPVTDVQSDDDIPF